MHDKVKSRSRRAIPAVTRILDSLGRVDLPRPLIVDLVRRELSKLRASEEIPEFKLIVDLARTSVENFRASRLQAIVNGTGVIVHTNLGRSPLANEAAAAVREIASSYNNLEFDLTTGERGDRGLYIENALAQLCGAQSATIVNNCAAGLVLIVRHFTRARGRARQCQSGSDPASGSYEPPTRTGAPLKSEVIVSRGELVQIGGGFRIGEILEASGAADYSHAVNSQTALILKVHRSNFFMSGFVESPSSANIAALAQRKRIPFVEDLGSGAMLATEQLGLHEHEPTPNEAIKHGADLVCFSGDKLFGGPQAGIIAGKKRFITALKREPLFRALRCDKLVFAALQATVDLHLNQALAEIPALALLRIPKDELRARAAATLVRLRGLPLQITIGRGVARVGGGTLPKSIVSSVTIDILPENCSVHDFCKCASQIRSTDRWLHQQ